MNEIVQVNADKISNLTNYKPEEIAILKQTVAKGTTDTELAYFLSLSRSVDLNPFVKEIWCYKDNKNNLLVFTGRDGFLAHAQKQKSYAGIRSSEVRENDLFTMDIFNNKIKHEFGKEKRGNILGAYAVVFRKDGEPTIEWAEFDTYNKGYNTWKTHPAEMIKKVAETHALKKAFGLSGIQSEYDFEVKNDLAIPIETEKTDLAIDLQKELETYKDPMELENDKIALRDKYFKLGMSKKDALETIQRYLDAF